jgi:hypothetical protein
MICRLCLEEKDLRNSHIIPEFFYRPLYDEKHRINTLISDKEILEYHQKGVRERLLCDDCEQQIGKYENYVRKMFYGGVALDFPVNPSEIIIKNVIYESFKLFQLSLLWRASISSHWFFKFVNIGPYEEKIRQMLLNENPGGKYDIGCLLAFYLDDTRKVVDGLILQPINLRANGHRSFAFVIGGALWLFVVSSHSKDFEHSDYFADDSGDLRIVLKPVDKLLSMIVSKFRKSGRRLETD